MIDLRFGDSIVGMQTIRAGSIPMIYADPPYNLSGKSFMTVRNGRPVPCDKGEWDVVENLHEFNREWIAGCVRVLSDEGTLWISGTLHNHPSVGMVLKELGLWIINDVIWFKRNATPLMAKNRFAPSTELIWVAAKSKRYFFDYDMAKQINGGRQMRNLWEINAEKHKTSHPAEKPESLLSRIIAIGSRPGDTILDPFMGSGTTGVVAQQMGRHFVGFETAPEYFDIASRRISSACQPALPSLSAV
jgi:site-specific DNA-methyltransferase (adenine-specific)